MELLDKFPVEGGQKDPKRRIIPFLPGKSWTHSPSTTNHRKKKEVAHNWALLGINGEYTIFTGHPN